MEASANYFALESFVDSVTGMGSLIFLMQKALGTTSTGFILQVERWNEQRENGTFPGPL